MLLSKAFLRIIIVPWYVSLLGIRRVKSIYFFSLWQIYCLRFKYLEASVGMWFPFYLVYLFDGLRECHSSWSMFLSLITVYQSLWILNHDLLVNYVLLTGLVWSFMYSSLVICHLFVDAACRHVLIGLKLKNVQLSCSSFPQPLSHFISCFCDLCAGYLNIMSIMYRLQ